MWYIVNGAESQLTLVLSCNNIPHSQYNILIGQKKALPGTQSNDIKEKKTEYKYSFQNLYTNWMPPSTNSNSSQSTESRFRPVSLLCALIT